MKRGIAVLCVAMMVFVACQSQSEEPDSGDEGDGGAPVSLRWRTRPDNQAEIDVYKQVSDSLDEQLENIELEYEPGGSESSSYQDVLKTEIAAGTAPDVFWIPGSDVADFAKRGLIMDIRELADGTDGYSDDDFYAGPMETLTYSPDSGQSGDALWGIPRDVSTFALYLNLDLIEEAGADDPRELEAQGEWDWDAFYEVASDVAALGGPIKGYGQNAWWGPNGYWINSAGGDFYNEDRTACAVDSPEAIEGLEFMTTLYQDEVAVPYGEDSEPPFLAGQVGMFQNGRWATPGTRESAKFDWDVVGLPEGPAGQRNWLFWGAYAVNAETEHPEEAWELIQNLTTPETQATIAELGANIPSRVTEEAKEAFLGYTPPENNQAFLAALDSDPVSEEPLWQGSFPEFDALLGPAIQAVVTGEQSLEEFQSNICGELDPTFTG